jgi:hypothetical protein
MIFKLEKNCKKRKTHGKSTSKTSKLKKPEAKSMGKKGTSKRERTGEKMDLSIFYLIFLLFDIPFFPFILLPFFSVLKFCFLIFQLFSFIFLKIHNPSNLKKLHQHKLFKKNEKMVKNWSCSFAFCLHLFCFFDLLLFFAFILFFFFFKAKSNINAK